MLLALGRGAQPAGKQSDGSLAVVSKKQMDSVDIMLRLGKEEGAYDPHTRQ